jgi:ADP-ribosylglycohydrolase
MMRSAILGVFAGDDPDYLRGLVRANTRITHTDPKAERAARVVAGAAWLSASGAAIAPADATAQLLEWIDGDAELAALLEQVRQSAEAGESTPEFCRRLGMERGVPGYCYATLPVVLHGWLSHPRDFERAITAAVECGGDTDTVAAILGGIVGAGVGPEGIPPAWIEHLWEWPRTTGWMQRLARELAFTRMARLPRRPPGAFFPFVLVRNFFFTVIVLAHGFRRLLPPY